jgi:hypothetical protein
MQDPFLVYMPLIGALRVYIPVVHGPLELMTGIQVDYGWFARFLRAQSVSSVNSQRFLTG